MRNCLERKVVASRKMLATATREFWRKRPENASVLIFEIAVTIENQKNEKLKTFCMKNWQAIDHRESWDRIDYVILTEWASNYNTKILHLIALDDCIKYVNSMSDYVMQCDAVNQAHS